MATSRRAFLAATASAAALTTTAPALACPSAEPELQAALAECERTEAVSLIAEDASFDAWEHYGELGGPPAFPNALFEREGDRSFGIFHTCRDHDDPAGEQRPHVSADMLVALRASPRRRAALRWEAIPAHWRDRPFVHRRTRDGVEEHGVTVMEPCPMGQARADEILAAWDARLRETHDRRTRAGVDAADAALATSRAEFKSARRILAETPARTTRGVQMKVAFVLALFEGLDDLSEEIARTDRTTDVQVALSIVRDLVTLTGEG